MNTQPRVKARFHAHRRMLLFLLMFALIFVRFCVFGFEYYHQLDDYIQYHNYAQGSDLLGTVKNLGLLAARPLAGLADIFVWSRFFDNMIIAVAILSAMYAASALLLQRVFNRHFGTGYVFLAAFTLLPLGIEGTYWVSASSRIIAGLFFAALAFYFFDRSCSGGSFLSTILYAFFQLISFGFYEQSLIFSLTGVLLLAALNFHENKKRAGWGSLTFVNAAIYLGFTTVFQNSAVYAGRMSFINPFTRYYWDTALPNIAEQFYNAFFKGGFLIFTKGALRGLEILADTVNFGYAAVIILLCAAFFAAARRGEYKAKNPVLSLCTGFLLALAPISIFLVLDNPWFSLRCTVMSFCGFSIIADTLCSLCMPQLPRGGKTVMAAGLALFALVCCVSSVSELCGYRDTTAFDRAFIEALSARLEADNRLDRSLKIAILGVEPSYLTEQNFYYHEHIHGVTESGWALTGALEWRVGINRPDVTPLPEWNVRGGGLADYDALYRCTGAGQGTISLLFLKEK